MPDNDSAQGDVVASGSNAGDDAVPHTEVSAGSRESASSPENAGVVTAGPKAGDVIAGAKLDKVIYSDSLHAVWSAKAGKNPFSVHILNPSVQGAAAKRFLDCTVAMLTRAVKAPIPGLLRLHAMQPDGRAFVSDLWTIGTVYDLPALSWALDKQVNFFGQLCAILQTLHTEGMVHGCLAPSCVQLDDDLNPVVADVGMFDPEDMIADRARAPYVAPEVEQGEPPTVSSDIFALGQLLHGILIDAAATTSGERIPRLDDLAGRVQPGLVRIVRRCLARDPSARYATVAELVAELGKYEQADLVGLVHPDVSDALAVAEPPQRASFIPPSGSHKKPDVPVAAPKRKVDLPASTSLGIWAKIKAPRSKWIRVVVLGSIFVTGITVAFGCDILAMAWIWRLVAAFGLAGISLWQNFWPKPRDRAIVGAVVFLITWLANVGGISFVLEADRNLRANDPASAVEAMKQARAAGARKFNNAIFHHGDLSGLDLSKSNFDWAQFNFADLSNASLVGSSAVGANFEQTNLSGANMRDTAIQMAVNFKTAICDVHTSLPKGWSCADGHPSPK